MGRPALTLTAGRRYRLRRGPCPCGCGEQVDLPRVFATDRCRQALFQREYREQHGISYRRRRRK